MLTYPNIDPVAIHLGEWHLPLLGTVQPGVRWYGLMYLIGFAAVWWLGSVRAKRAGSQWQRGQISDLVFYGALGAVLGGRVGSVLFYNFPGFVADPLSLLRVWEGGMSFHGGLIGVLLALWLYGRHYKKTFFEITDFVAPLIPIGLGAGRIGNFINGELWGKVSDVPWAMIFPNGGSLARHPSQLYQALLEGVVLFAILWLYSNKPRPTMAVSGLFLIAYGLFRFIVEFVREPDQQLGYLAFGWLTMGQVLSAPMILLGLWLMWRAHRTVVK